MDGSPLGEPPTPHGTGPVSVQSASAGIRWQAPSRPGSGPQVAAAPLLEPQPVVEPAQPEPAEEEESLIGAVLSDRYRIDARIGAGGMGLVYKATHLLIGRTLAIKVLRRRYAEQDEVAKRFALEARVASSVKHMNVVDLLDYGTTPLGSPFYVMEFLDGRSLARELARNGSIEPARALDIACQIARGLSAAHQAGVIHRDLKPDNVYLVAADQHGPELVKILDFGIAHVSGRKTRLTAAGAVVGTPEYMSPEQARGTDLDGRSDLYALGVVLFEALTGKVPLSAESTVGTLTKQVFELAPRLRDRDPRFAAFPSVEAALGRLLAKNRDERPATALDALRLIQTAALNDLEKNNEDSRSRAALDGWNHPHALALVPERDIARRSTIMIGSGSVSRAHDGDADGPATGSFAAKQREEEELHKRPSIIVRDGVPITVRPPPLDGETTPDSVSPVAPIPAAPRAPVSKTPTPDRNRALGKPPGRGFARRNLPLILLAIGAAIFAALVTIGFVRWMQRREARTSLPTPAIETTDARRS
jgi:serine/threonine protein kinase